MRLDTKKRISIAAAGLALATGALPAHAQADREPLRVGIIDTDASRAANPKKGITVEMRSFLPDGKTPASHKTASYQEHGADVMFSFIEQARKIDASRPIAIYSAVAFYRSGDREIDEQKNRPMAIDYDAAVKSLDWFKEHGVKVVVTAFIIPDNASIRRLTERARELDITIVASTNNAQSTYKPFPAFDPQTISVTGADRNLQFQFDGSMKNWVSFQSSGAIPGKSLWEVPENGSSFAAGRVAAYVANVRAADPSLSRDAIVAKLRSVASEDKVPSLDGDKVVKRFQAVIAAQALPRSMAKGPAGPESAITASLAIRTASASR